MADAIIRQPLTAASIYNAATSSQSLSGGLHNFAPLIVNRWLGGGGGMQQRVAPEADALMRSEEAAMANLAANDTMYDRIVEVVRL